MAAENKIPFLVQRKFLHFFSSDLLFFDTLQVKIYVCGWVSEGLMLIREP